MNKHPKHLTSLKAKMNLRRSLSDKFADQINSGVGSISFFIFHLVFFTVWILLNSHVFPGAVAFDPYPFSFLTMVVSLEAIFLSIFVLISQNRASVIADLREEVDLQLTVQAEQEITRMIIMVDEIHDKLGLKPEDDAELKRMKKHLNIEKMERALLKEMKD